MALFVDASIWYAAADSADKGNSQAKSILRMGESLLTTDHVLVETWTLLRYRIHRGVADRFWDSLRSGVASVEPVGSADLEMAWQIGMDYDDHEFSIVDRTSFAVMRRLGIMRAASFDNDFAVFRFGPKRRQAFTVIC
jgi:predicted nucleic acid-binding protein